MKKIYLLQAEGTDLYKIGITGKPIEYRIKELQTGNGNKLVLISEFKTEFDYLFERTLHRHFELQKTEGEWFNLTLEQVKSFIIVCERINTNFKVLKESENHFML